MILDIRGTHGSGKSYIPHTLLKEHGPAVPILEGNTHLGYHLPKFDLAIVGKYDTNCGGCDGVGSADEVVRRVRLFHKQYRHVLLEGILVSHTFKRYNALAEELGDYWFLFLNTPLATCIARVKARRRKAGNTKSLNPTNIIKDWHGVWKRVRAQCLNQQRNVKVLDYRDPLPTVLELLGS